MDCDSPPRVNGSGPAASTASSESSTPHRLCTTAELRGMGASALRAYVRDVGRSGIVSTRMGGPSGRTGRTAADIFHDVIARGAVADVSPSTSPRGRSVPGADAVAASRAGSVDSLGSLPRHLGTMRIRTSSPLAAGEDGSAGAPAPRAPSPTGRARSPSAGSLQSALAAAPRGGAPRAASPAPRLGTPS